MKDNVELIYSNFDEKTEKSVVVIRTDLGIFVGTSQLRTEDFKHKSRYRGCEYAEIKARLKYEKEKIKQKKKEIKLFTDFYKNILQSKSHKENYESKMIKEKIAQLENEYNTLKTKYDSYIENFMGIL